MARFLVGMLVGIAIAFGYVRYDIALPDWLALPDRLKGNLISTAAEVDLYDLERDAATRSRALETYFAHRAIDAARVDAESGHPFLNALYRKRAVREARTLTGEWSAYELALAKPELRRVLEKRYATTESELLKKRMLAGSLEKQTFLKQWIAANIGEDGGDILAILRRIAADPALPAD